MIMAFKIKWHISEFVKVLLAINKDFRSIILFVNNIYKINDLEIEFLYSEIEESCHEITWNKSAK